RAPQPERRRDPPRARGQPLPLHRLPQHRQGRPGRGERVKGARMAVTERPAKFVGTSQLRKEDAELITGRGNYVDNISVPGMLWVALVRSPFAHARINGIDASRARELPGVV